jgi:uncharacterized OB-fold protein
VCTECWSEDLDWEQCRGTGVVESFTVLHRAPFPGFPVPWVLALVALAEGHVMLSGLVECDPATLTIGAAVEVVFEAAGDGLVVPLFRVRGPRTATPGPGSEQ